MVGGTDYRQSAFNLATNGHRQPGSAFKPFTLVRALADGVSPETTFVSEPQHVQPPERALRGQQLRRQLLRRRVAAHGHRDVGQLRVRPARPEGGHAADRAHGAPHGHPHAGLDEPGDDAGRPAGGGHARSRWPTPTRRSPTTACAASGSLAPGKDGPVGIEWVKGKGIEDENKVRPEAGVPGERRRRARRSCSAGVVSGGTGKAAQIGEFAAGKTGTTENYGDAWFVGFNKELTVAVWVGYPDKLVPMQTEYHGEPGGGRHVPGRDLARLHARRDRHPRPAPDRPAARTRTRTTRPPRPRSRPVPRRPSRAPRRRRARPTTTAPQDEQQQAPEAAPAPETPAPQDNTPVPETPPPSTPPATPAPDPGGGGGDGGAVAPG